MPPGHKNTTDDMRLGTNFCKTEELATGHTKHFEFPPEPLPQNHVWELLSTDKSGTHADKMFPARQHTTAIQSFDIPLVGTSTANYTSMHIQWHPQPMPLIQLDSPHILSENGNMKFIYRTRWDISVPYTLHIKPHPQMKYHTTNLLFPIPKPNQHNQHPMALYPLTSSPHQN
jgi:hypothetical protein